MQKMQGSHHGPPIPDASVFFFLHEPQRPDRHNVQIGSTTCEFDAVVEVAQETSKTFILGSLKTTTKGGLFPLH